MADDRELITDCATRFTEIEGRATGLKKAIDENTEITHEILATVKGNGKPGLITQIAVLENTIKLNEKAWSEKCKRLWWAIGTLISLVVTIIVRSLI